MGTDNIDNEPHAQIARELEALKRVSAVVASALGDDEVMRVCLDLNIELARASGGMVYLVEPETRDFRLILNRAVPDTIALHRYPATSFHQRLATMPADFVPITTFEFTDAAQRSIEENGIRSLLLIALRFSGQLVGVAVLTFATTESPRSATLETLIGIAGAQATGIMNARTKDELERRTALAILLHSFAKSALSASTDAELFDIGVATAMELAKSDGAHLSLWSQTHAKCVASRGTEVPAVGAEVPLAVLGLHFQTDSETGVRMPLTYFGGPVSYLRAELHRGKVPIGHIAAQRRSTAGPYTAAQVEAFETMGAMMSQALERIAIQQESARRSLRLHQILENLPMSVVVLERSGKIAHANAFALSLMRDHDVDPNQSWRTILPGLIVAKADGTHVSVKQNPVSLAFDGERVAPSEFNIVFPAGTKKRTALVSAAPLMGGGDGPVEECLVVLQDISPLREVMEERERFLAIAAHELRSPVTTLRGTCSMLQLDSSALLDDTRRGQLIARLDRQTERLSRLVTQLLECARLGNDELPLSLQQGNLVSICHEAMVLVSTGASPAKIEFESEPELIGVWDLDRLEQVVVNLLSNALRYSEADGHVTLSTRAAGDRVIIRVADDGVGIDPEHQKRLFSPFFRAPVAQEKNKVGVGLGLYVTAVIVRRHGGTIEVVSAPKQGATFTVTLPRYTIENV